MAGPSAEETANPTPLDPTRKAELFTDVLRARASGAKVDPKDWADFVRAQNEDLKTGPKIGERVPDFTLPDQNGKQHLLRDLMGPNGLLLVFTRSADW